jgi:hypothetical protein
MLRHGYEFKLAADGQGHPRNPGAANRSDDETMMP